MLELSLDADIGQNIVVAAPDHLINLLQTKWGLGKGNFCFHSTNWESSQRSKTTEDTVRANIRDKDFNFRGLWIKKVGARSG